MKAHRQNHFPSSHSINLINLTFEIFKMKTATVGMDRRFEANVFASKYREIAR